LKKEKKKIFSTLPLYFSLPPTHLFYYLLKKIRKGEKKKKTEKVVIIYKMRG